MAKDSADTSYILGEQGQIISAASMAMAKELAEASNANLQSLRAQLADLEEGSKQYSKKLKQIKKEEENSAKRAQEIAEQLDAKRYSNLSDHEKKLEAKKKKAFLQEQANQKELELDRLRAIKTRTAAEQKYMDKLLGEQTKLQEAIAKSSEEVNKYRSKASKAVGKAATPAANKIRAGKEKVSGAVDSVKSSLENKANDPQASGIARFGAKAGLGTINAGATIVGDIKTNIGLMAEATMTHFSENLSKNLESMANKMNDVVNSAIEDVVSHRTGVMARLQGLGGEYDYDGLTEKVADNLATSPYIKQQDFMKKLDDAVDKGIAYNVEQRTFLATVSDKIATTFDAFDANLLRLIRLQQADSTAARLGMEAALTKTLNTVFSDTSYLSDVYGQVSAAILDSEAIMSRDDAAEYEYVVQKWLGSLYSTGVSTNTINQIAQGLNYIGTGNVSALAGNSPLQTLFAMSASRANGLSYADLLTGGLDAAKTNELLKSMVEYLQEIAENSGNNVVKSAWGDIYRMSLADMRAVASLTGNDISSIYAQNMSYSDMTTELNNQFNSISKRMSTGEMMSNVIDNFVYTIGSDIATSAVSYVMWEITDLIQSATGGINLPAISVMGNMVDLSAFTVEGLIKTGIVGMNVLSSIGTILGSIGKNGGLDMGIWGGQEYLTRGKVETTTNGWTSTTSGSTYVGSSSSSDMKNSSIAGATEDAEEVSDITNANNKTEHTFDEFFEEVLINGWPIHTKSVGEYTVSDLYSRMYVDKTPVPVIMDTSAGVGAAVALMAMNINKVSDVNIKSADTGLSVTLMGLDSKFRDSVKSYLKTTFTEAMADEIKKTVIGSSSGDTNTIAKVCKKILDDSVDVVIKNTNFDNALDRYYMNGF